MELLALNPAHRFFLGELAEERHAIAWAVGAPRVDPFRASVLCTRPFQLTVVFVAKSWISIRRPSRSSQPSASSPRMLEGGVKVFSTFRFRVREGGL